MVAEGRVDRFVGVDVYGDLDGNGNLQPVKATSPKYRIDGLASLLDAYVGLLDHYNEYLDAI